MVIDYLRRRFPNFSNGELAAFKVCLPCEPPCPLNDVLPADRHCCSSHPQSNIVSHIALDAFCVEMDLHVTMQWETAPLWNTVQKYARQVTKAKEEEVAAARGEGRQLKSYWADFDPPRVRFSELLAFVTKFRLPLMPTLSPLPLAPGNRRHG